MGRGRYPVSEFDSKVTSKISIKGQVNCLLTLFVWYVFETKERGTERRVAVPRGEGGTLYDGLNGEAPLERGKGFHSLMYIKGKRNLSFGSVKGSKRDGRG